MTAFVLVHGAFRGTWWWDRVAARLRSAGHEVHTPALTGLGDRASELAPSQNLETYVDDVLAVLRDNDLRDVVLVAHSFAGYPVTAAADREPERIGRLVYLDAVVPADGQSSATASPAAGAAWMAAAGDDGWSVPPMPVDVLSVNEDDRDEVATRLTRMPLAALLQRVRLTGRVERIPRRELVFASGWAATPYREQFERLRVDPAWQVTELPTGHEVMLDDPDAVVAILLDDGSVSPGGSVAR